MIALFLFGLLANVEEAARSKYRGCLVSHAESLSKVIDRGDDHLAGVADLACRDERDQFIAANEASSIAHVSTLTKAEVANISQIAKNEQVVWIEGVIFQLRRNRKLDNVKNR